MPCSKPSIPAAVFGHLLGTSNPRRLTPSCWCGRPRPPAPCCGEELKKVRRTCRGNLRKRQRRSAAGKFSAVLTKRRRGRVLQTACGKKGCGRFHRFTDLITTTSWVHRVSGEPGKAEEVVAVHILAKRDGLAAEASAGHRTISTIPRRATQIGFILFEKASTVRPAVE